MSLVCILVAALALVPAAAGTDDFPDLERFDGSYRLETGEVLTGGYPAKW